MENKGAKFTIFALLGVIALMFLRECNGCIEYYQKPKESDTVTLTRTDTVWAKDTVYKLNTVVLPRVHDSVRIYSQKPSDSLICSYIRFYRDSLEDKNLVVFMDDSVQGLLLSRSVGYRLKVPLTINTVTDNFITTYNDRKWVLRGGMETGASRLSPSLSLGAQVTVNEQYTGGYRYDLLNKSHNVSLYLTLLKSKNNKK